MVKISMPLNNAQRLRHFQKIVKQKQQQILGINPNEIKPRVLTKSQRRAQTRLKIPKGTVALMSLRPIAPQLSVEERVNAKARTVLGDEIKKGFSRTAIEKTPLTKNELKMRLFAAAHRVGKQRRVQNRIAALSEQLKAFSKARTHFVMVLNAGDLFKLRKVTLPKVDVPQLRRMIKDNPNLRELGKLFDSELICANSESEQRQNFIKAPTLGKVLQKGKGFIMIESKGKTGATNRIIFSSYNGIREEAKRRAKIVSRGLTQIKKELMQKQKEVSNGVNATEVLEHSQPLMQAYRNLGKGELTAQARREIYEKYGGKEESARRALLEEEQKIRAGKLAQKIMPLKVAQNDIRTLSEVYAKLAETSSFSQGANLMASSQVIIDMVAQGYIQALRTIPELKRLSSFESIQLLLPESEEDMIRTRKGNGLNPKKVVGSAVLLKVDGRPYLLPTTVAIMKALARTRVEELQKGFEALEEKIKSQSNE